MKSSIVTQLYLLCVFFWRTFFVFLDVFSLFCFVRYRNRAAWISLWCHFCDISILFSSFESPLEAMLPSWFLTSGLSGAHNLTTSRLKRNGSSFHHRQTLFVNRSVVRQLCIVFVPTNTFCLFRCIGPFLPCAISESGFEFHLGVFFVIRRFCLVVLGSSRAHVLVVDPVNRATWLPRAEILEFEAWGLLFPSVVNLVYGKQHCARTWIKL